jgi:nucleoid-associated protein YgaU
MSTATIPFAPLKRTASSRDGRAITGPVRPQASRADSEAWGSMRLTRRGRVALLAGSLGLAFGGFTLVGGPAESTGAAHHAAAEQVVVEPGQTLWDIAQDVAPGEDTRTVIAEIVELNTLSSAGDIRAGQPLYVPEY